VLRLEGRDVLDLLHRLSTRHLIDLAPGECRAAPFCDFRGRLLHRAVVAATRDGAVWLLRDDARGDELTAFVDRSVFREDVSIADLAASWSACAAPEGDAAVARAHAAGAGDAPASGTGQAGTVEERESVPVRARIAPAWAIALVPAGTPCPPRDEPARIRAGRPRDGHEIHPDFTPFEVGLAHEVHLAKGCYTGQEALMRLVTYRSVRRRLVRLGGDGAAPVAPCDVRADGAVAGRLTSATEDAAGGWIGLAVLRHEAASPGVRLEIEGAGAVREPAPFDLTQPLGLA
jgi:folate-binding protein YgfZ